MPQRNIRLKNLSGNTSFQAKAEKYMNGNATSFKLLEKTIIWAIALATAGCAGLLPEATQETRTQWRSYVEAETVFARIIPGKTSLAELKALGIDPEQTPNVALLGHADLLRRLDAVVSFEIETMDPALKACVSARQKCFAYELEQSFVERKRIGNFWLDFLSFKRTTDISGWQFDALVLISNDTVIYKLWSGKPKIHQSEVERNPLGPLQGLGSSLVRR